MLFMSWTQLNRFLHVSWEVSIQNFKKEKTKIEKNGLVFLTVASKVYLLGILFFENLHQLKKNSSGLMWNKEL